MSVFFCLTCVCRIHALCANSWQFIFIPVEYSTLWTWIHLSSSHHWLAFVELLVLFDILAFCVSQCAHSLYPFWVELKSGVSKSEVLSTLQSIDVASYFIIISEWLYQLNLLPAVLWSFCWFTALSNRYYFLFLYFSNDDDIRLYINLYLAQWLMRLSTAFCFLVFIQITFWRKITEFIHFSFG